VYSSVIRTVLCPGAADDALYPKLGFVDAAIGAVARVHNCTVLTDGLNLYLWLTREKVNVIQLRL
jgi:hypothetical protein